MYAHDSEWYANHYLSHRSLTVSTLLQLADCPTIAIIVLYSRKEIVTQRVLRTVRPSQNRMKSIGLYMYAEESDIACM